ncbi:hypothetical protein [Dactylosporangium sp. CA-233914]|uniref:hypothetical protein n=1 Tax=Dactylosporangium sp. CA-233914 TaxID=3239934 RepID=UPI003D8D2696
MTSVSTSPGGGDAEDAIVAVAAFESLLDDRRRALGADDLTPLAVAINSPTPAQIRAQTHRGRTGVVDGRLEVRAVVEHIGEEPELVRRAGQFRVQPLRAQARLTVGHRHQRRAAPLDRRRHGPQHRRPAGAPGPVRVRVCGAGALAQPVEVLGGDVENLGGGAGAWVDADDHGVYS